MKKLRSLFVLTVLTVALSAMAVQARRDPQRVTQPDGSELTLRLVGDEFNHFYITDDDEMVIRDNGGYYFATVDAAGNLAPSKVLASDPQRRSASQTAFVNSINKKALSTAVTRRQTAAKAKRSASAAGPDGPARVGLFPGSSFPTSGSPKCLIILVQYSDVSFTLSDPYDYFNGLLNTHGFSQYSAQGSVLDYFTDASNGQFTPEFVVKGPVTLSQPREYYGGNDSGGNDKKPAEMVTEACSALDSEVNFADFDTNNDGYVDNIFIFYAGQGEASGGSDDCVWPHAWDVYSGTGSMPVLDGVRIYKYGCTNEWGGTTTSGRPDGIGTFCHEFSHVIGLPDLYDVTYGSAKYLTPSSYSIMDYGNYSNDGRTPPTYSAFERNAFGWAEIEELTPGVGRTGKLTHMLTSNKAYMVTTSSTNEFFLFENRQKTGWDAYIPGHGMLVWHIDYDSSKWTANTVNTTSTHQYVDIEEAGGTANSNNSTTMAKYPFPGTANVTSFTDDTTPSMKTWSGTSLNVPLTNITESSGVITFDVCGGPSTDPEDPVITDVATPVVSVNGTPMTDEVGTYNQPVSVTIECATEGATLLIQCDELEIMDEFEAPYTLTVDRDAYFEVVASAEGYNDVEIQFMLTFEPEAPVISPATGEYEEMPEVTMSCATSDTTIRYTLDGTTPSLESELYTAPFTPETPAEGALTVTARAFRTGWSGSAASTATYTIVEPSVDPEDPQDPEEPTTSGTATFDFYQLWNNTAVQSDSWSNSYSDHTATYPEGTVAMKASNQSSTVADYPVTKGSDLTVTMAQGYTPITEVTLNAVQWSSKAQTITLQSSTDGETFTTVEGVSSSDFTLTCSALPEGTVAVKFKFSSTSNQVGLKSVVVKYGTASSGEDPDPENPDPEDPEDPDPEDPENPDPSTPDIVTTFDFTGEEAYGMTLLSGSASSYNDNPTICTETDGTTMTLKGSTRWWSASNGNALRFYKNSSFTIDAPEGYLITDITLANATSSKWEASEGKFDSSNNVWAGKSSSVTFSTTITSSNTSLTGVNVTLLAIPTFTMTRTYYEHASDKSVTLYCEIEHSNAVHVTRYEIWVIDVTDSTPAQSRANTSESENIVGTGIVSGEALSGPTVNAAVSLDNLTPDSGVHMLVVRAKAFLKDESSVYSTSYAEGDPEGSTGEYATTVDTSLSETTTGIGSIESDRQDASTIYYNLHGVMIDNPSAPGIYLRREGNRIVKVVVK